jgi:hypothetical protein
VFNYTLAIFRRTNKLRALCFIGLFILSYNLWASNSTSEEKEPPTEGIFSLPYSQQPGPFFAFGQNIIEKNQLQYVLTPNYAKGKNQSYLDLTPSFVYGLSDTASVYATLPFALHYQTGEEHSSGVSDASLQLEYAFYDKTNAFYLEEATLVTGVTVPSGSYNKSPETGSGSPTFFIGSTFNHSYVDWLWFFSPGVTVFTPHHHYQAGSQYIYQAGVGHDLGSVANKYIICGLIELSGQYVQKDKASGQFDHDSGGNTIYYTPSLFFSTPKWIVQLAVSSPVFQRLNGDQDREYYYLSAYVAYLIQ